MNTFNIQISETQLNLIKNALQKDSTYSESEEFLIGMIEDIIEEKDKKLNLKLEEILSAKQLKKWKKYKASVKKK